MKKVLAIVVTYYPEEKLLKENIFSFIDCVDKVLIWENTAASDKLKYRFVSHKKAEYCGDGINSISRALNYAWQYAKKYGYDYLLTMDQDSVWENFEIFRKKIVSNPFAPVGIYCPDVFDKNINNEFEECNMAITSGMFIPVGVINQIGGWNELFEIDSVDDEFCLHAHSLGIKTYVVKGAIMKQIFGFPQTIHVLGHVWILRNYAPFRLYNVFKDNIILIKRYPQFDYIKENFKESWLRYIKFVILFESDKVKKLVAIAKGIIAGLRYKEHFRE